MAKHSDLKDRARVRADRDGIGLQAAIRIEREAAKRRQQGETPIDEVSPLRTEIGSAISSETWENIGTNPVWVLRTFSVPEDPQPRPVKAYLWWEKGTFDPSAGFATFIDRIHTDSGWNTEIVGSPTEQTFRFGRRTLHGIQVSLRAVSYQPHGGLPSPRPSSDDVVHHIKLPESDVAEIEARTKEIAEVLGLDAATVKTKHMLDRIEMLHALHAAHPTSELQAKLDRIDKLFETPWSRMERALQPLHPVADRISKPMAGQSLIDRIIKNPLSEQMDRLDRIMNPMGRLLEPLERITGMTDPLRRRRG